MHWAVDIDLIRDLLGDDIDLTDEEILTDAIIIPILQQVKAYCPAALDSTSEEDQKLVRVAVAHLVAATTMAMAPRMASSKLGDSTVTFVSGDVDIRADGMERKAWTLLDTICAGASYGSFPMFKLASGGNR